MYDNLTNRAISISLLITIMSMCRDDKNRQVTKTL